MKLFFSSCPFKRNEHEIKSQEKEKKRKVKVKKKKQRRSKSKREEKKREKKRKKRIEAWDLNPLLGVGKCFPSSRGNYGRQNPRSGDE